MSSQMYQTQINGRIIVVEKLKEIFLRTGAAMKDSAVLYRDTRDGEISVRRKAEFERLFVRCE